MRCQVWTLLWAEHCGLNTDLNGRSETVFFSSRVATACTFQKKNVCILLGNISLTLIKPRAAWWCGGYQCHPVTARRFQFKSRLGSFCVEFPCSPRTFVGSLLVLHLPPTVQKHATDPKGECGCAWLFVLFVSVIDWWPVQGVPSISLNGSWDRVQNWMKQGIENGWIIKPKGDWAHNNSWGIPQPPGLLYAKWVFKLVLKDVITVPPYCYIHGGNYWYSHFDIFQLHLSLQYICLL